MRFTIALIVVLAAFVTSAQAISRHQSTRLSCDAVHAIIEAEGAAIMRYPSRRNPSLTLYDRYVRHTGYCASGEYAKLDTIPTADAPACPVLKCFQKTFLRD